MNNDVINAKLRRARVTIGRQFIIRIISISHRRKSVEDMVSRRFAFVVCIVSLLFYDDVFGCSSRRRRKRKYINKTLEYVIS